MTDRDRDAVERLCVRLCHPEAAFRPTISDARDAAATLRALLAAKEAAEAGRDAGLIREKDANAKAMQHLRRAEKAEIASKNHAAFSYEWRDRAETAEAEAAALRGVIKEYLESEADSAGGAPDKWAEAQKAFHRLRAAVDWPTKALATIDQPKEGQ